MLFLLMQLDRDRYAIDIRQVAAVLPFIDLHATSDTSIGVAGLIDYGGTPVPVIDLSQLLANRPAHRRFNTRIVLVHCEAEVGNTRLLGLIAERATETVRREPADFKESGIPHTSSEPCRVALDATGALRWLDVDRLLPEPLRQSLFKQAGYA